MKVNKIKVVKTLCSCCEQELKEKDIDFDGLSKCCWTPVYTKVVMSYLFRKPKPSFLEIFFVNLSYILAILVLIYLLYLIIK